MCQYVPPSQSDGQEGEEGIDDTARTMTRIGFILNFFRRTTQRRKTATRTRLVFFSTMAASLPQKEEIRMEIPEEATMATTAGRREPKIP